MDDETVRFPLSPLVMIARSYLESVIGRLRLGASRGNGRNEEDDRESERAPLRRGERARRAIGHPSLF